MLNLALHHIVTAFKMKQYMSINACPSFIQEGWYDGNIHLTNIFPVPTACQVPVLPLAPGKWGPCPGPCTLEGPAIS